MVNKSSLLRYALVLRVITALILFDLVPTANAGVLDWVKKIGNTMVVESEIDSRGAFVYVSNQNNWLQVHGVDTELASPILEDGYILAHSGLVAKSATAEAYKKFTVIQELRVPTTAYSSTPDQTDDSPFITAWNTPVRDGVVAANFLTLGTRIKIPEVFGDRIFIVEDRMNKRYWQRVDIWFPDRESALQFGIKSLKIQILES